MGIPNNITKEHLLQAILKIDNEGIPKDGDSHYYDVIYNTKKYPPKLIVAYANLYANGEILDRNSFNGGLDTKCFKLLKDNGFVIEEKNKLNTQQPKVWFVTQGSTYSPQRGMQFLWAPAIGKDGRPRFYWDNLLKVKKGDIIFNYSEGLKGVSVASSDGYNSDNEDKTSQWGPEGFKVDIELTPLDPFISGVQLASKKTEIDKYLSPVINKPFNTNGGVNQGYLYEFTKEAGRFIRDMYDKTFGNNLIDDFFDKVNLKEQQSTIINNMNVNYKAFYEKVLHANFYINDRLCLRFISSLLTKPFVILTGLSGSGKTKLAQAFAMWICEDKKQYRIVPVGADWTNREPLLGFPSGLEPGKYVKPDSDILNLIIDASKDENKNKPFFLILDEMNLSHVERYFADFLSVMETKTDITLHPGNEDWETKEGDNIPPKINFPKNLFIIGTVNIDETTYMFSPKVLDRANVIEFRVTKGEMEIFLNSASKIDLESLTSAGSGMANGFVQIAKNSDLVADENIKGKLVPELVNFFVELKKTGAEFGYRTASEIYRFAAVVNLIEPNWSSTDIIDAAIMQKLLPKVHGSRRKLEPVLRTLGTLCLKEGQIIDDYISPKTEINFSDAKKIKYPISLEKILRMYHSLIANGFTSYAEA